MDQPLVKFSNSCPIPFLANDVFGRALQIQPGTFYYGDGMVWELVTRDLNFSTFRRHTIKLRDWLNNYDVELFSNQPREVTRDHLTLTMISEEVKAVVSDLILVLIKMHASNLVVSRIWTENDIFIVNGRPILTVEIQSFNAWQALFPTVTYDRNSLFRMDFCCLGDVIQGIFPLTRTPEDVKFLIRVLKNTAYGEEKDFYLEHHATLLNCLQRINLVMMGMHVDGEIMEPNGSDIKTALANRIHASFPEWWKRIPFGSPFEFGLFYAKRRGGVPPIRTLVARRQEMTVSSDGGGLIQYLKNLRCHIDNVGGVDYHILDQWIEALFPGLFSIIQEVLWNKGALRVLLGG